MNILETLVINAILVTFPILVYEYFIVYTQNMKKEKIKILLSMSLFISLYLTMYYKQYIPQTYQFTSIILPCIIAYLNKKPIDALVINLIITEYLTRELNYNIFVILIFNLTILLFYIHYSRTNKPRTFLTNASIVAVSLTLLLNEFEKITTNKTVLLDSMLAILMYFILIKIINKALDTAKDIINLHSNLKEFEKEKQIKISLFKITHEIKNPIAVIKGYIDMFNPGDKEKSERYIGIMKTEIERTLNLLTDFMEFTKIKIEKKEIEFNTLIDDIKEVLIPFFIAKNVNYYFEVENDLIINIDYARMKQVILNIIKNAVEASNPNIGQVSTTIFKDTESLYIYVKDNGIGMSKEVLDNMLTPFYTTKEKGTGLGVSLSKEIIEAHGGNLSYSSNLGKGTICKITLPLKN